MRSIMNWLSKMLESMANAFIHPVKNDLPPSIGAHAYSSICLLYTSPSPRDRTRSRMPSSA